MKKKTAVIILFFMTMIIVISASLLAHGGDYDTPIIPITKPSTTSATTEASSTECRHRYDLVYFSDGIATMECTKCKAVKYLNFIDYVNSDYDALDVNGDGIVNAKDYAVLNEMYQE